MPRHGFIVFAAAASALLPSPLQAAPAYDTIIRGGTIVDGSGLPAYRGDVAIKGHHIVAVGDLGAGEAISSIDATGLIVAPGFINIHSHADPKALPSAINMLTQGVTTEVVNADGFGETDIYKQLTDFAAGGLAENIGAYVGFNAVWGETIGTKNRRATAAEVATMRARIEENMARGAWGVSSGLDYKPAYYAGADQVAAIVSAAKPWRTNLPNHDRLRPEEQFNSYKGMAETIRIGKQAGLVPVITHMKIQGWQQGRAQQVIAMMADATARGTYTAADVYPYLAGFSSLAGLIMPGWALEGGRDAMLGRFKDPKLRARIIAEAENAMALRFRGPQGIYVLEKAQELTDVMKAMNVGAGEAVIRLIEQSSGNPAILRFGAEPDLRAFLAYRDAAVACDCGAKLDQPGHPREYGSFPRVLGHYVRDNAILTTENAIRKMTALPATIIGMTDRGYLAPGMAADITLYDPRTVKDHATYEASTRLSEGIRHVFVNGTQLLKDGTATGAKGGQVLLKSADMPSRPMTADVDRTVSATGTGPKFDISLAVTQRQGQRGASGYLQLLDRNSGTVWTADRLGLIQTAPGWASLTGIVRDTSGALKPVTVTLDHADRKGGQPQIIVRWEGGDRFVADPNGSIRIRTKPRS